MPKNLPIAPEPVVGVNFDLKLLNTALKLQELKKKGKPSNPRKDMDSDAFELPDFNEAFIKLCNAELDGINSLQDFIDKRMPRMSDSKRDSFLSLFAAWEKHFKGSENEIYILCNPEALFNNRHDPLNFLRSIFCIGSGKDMLNQHWSKCWHENTKMYLHLLGLLGTDEGVAFMKLFKYTSKTTATMIELGLVYVFLELDQLMNEMTESYTDTCLEVIGHENLTKFGISMVQMMLAEYFFNGVKPANSLTFAAED